ncbi:MAG: hypothetical protein JWN52_2267 [Actinomycetia bacterium]|nr:hypothetical protein [Actinomycetes bacterium]
MMRSDGTPDLCTRTAVAGGSGCGRTSQALVCDSVSNNSQWWHGSGTTRMVVARFAVRAGQSMRLMRNCWNELVASMRNTALITDTRWPPIPCGSGLVLVRPKPGG